MVGLKRFFHVDNFFQPPGVERNRIIVDDEPQAAEDCDYGRPSSRERSASDCSLGFSQQSYVNQKYLGIEKQFEEMHEQFRSRQLTPRDVKYTDLKPLPTRNRRHVDVLKAIFYTHREPLPSANSPTYYNEDIADRNLDAPQQQARQSQYACIVSAIYQEDVADRNILSSGSMLASPGSGSSGPSSRFDSRTSGIGHSTLDQWGHRKRREKSPTRHLGRRAGNNIVTMSEENLRTSAQKTQGHRETQRPQPDNLRLRSSAPNLSKTCPRGTTSRPPQRPTTGSRSMSSSSRKNILDLSIDTNLAAGKPSVKIDHCAVQPPTTSPSRQKLSPTIAEVVNSPLQIPTASAASLDATNTSYSVDEMMAMLRQAYAASQAKNQSPTFENLQNAIIREINSPGVLRAPSTASRIESPSIYSTPVSSAFKGETQTPLTESMRSSLLEEGRRLADYTKKGSPLERRGSETSIGNIPSSAMNGHDNENGTTPSRRRRHTYDQPQLGVVNTVQPFKKIHANNQEDHTHNDSKKDRHNEIETIPLPSASMPPTSPARSIVTPTADVDKITATIPMEPRSPQPTVNRTIGSISETDGKSPNFSRNLRYHTSPFPIGRRRIPLRRSSLFKDLYDSGRLAP